MPMKMIGGDKTGKTGKAATTTTIKTETEDGVETSHEADTEINDDLVESNHVGPWAQVGVEVGATVPTVQYGNIKATVQVVVPSPPDEVGDNYEVARDWALARLGELVEKMQSKS